MPGKPQSKPAGRAPLSRERVLHAAVRLADTVGIEALSMRRLGQQLGVEAMSLYNHVANKDDLLDGMVELVVAEIEAPEVGGDWKVAMRRRSISTHAVLMRHPWASMLIVSRLNVGPAMLRYVDATVGCLRAAGFSVAMADHAWNAIDAYVYGFTMQRLNFPLDPSDYASAAAAYLPTVSAGPYPHLAEMTRAIAESRHDGVQELEFGLDLLLEGLDRELANARSGS